MFIVHFSSNQSFFCCFCFVAHHHCIGARYLATLVVTPFWCTLLHLLSCLLVFTSHLATCASLLSFLHPTIFTTLLLTPCYLHCLAFITVLFSLPCYLRLVILPCWLMGLATLPLCLAGCWALLLTIIYSPFSSTSYPPLLLHCLATLGTLSPLPTFLCKWKNLE